MVLDQSTASLATQGTTVINADSAAPSAAEWLQNISALHLAFVIASTMATAVVIVLDFVHQYNIHYYVGNEHIQTDLYYLALLSPVVGLSSLLGMYLIRSASFLNVVSHTYVMVCLMALVSLLRVIFGGRDHVSEYLMSKNEFIQFSTPAVLLLLVATLTNAIEVIFMVASIYGCNITTNLGHVGFTSLFHIAGTDGSFPQFINLTQVFLTLQRFFFNVFGKLDGFRDSPHLSSRSKAMYWNSALPTNEMCLLSTLVIILFAHNKSAFFDKSDGTAQRISNLTIKNSKEVV